jgi:two-component system, chemotaxis family, CheB/CheR fusion protein
LSNKAILNTQTLSAIAKADSVSSLKVRPCIAGIGASAGGFNAIRHFFEAMPATTGVAFVVVQHLAPSHISLAAELFSKFTAMPVHEAVDGSRIEPNHVYTSPSDQELTILDGCLHLTPRKDTGHLRLPIDQFFNSLGEDCGARAIGIVLSGSGTDGALGLKTIASHGGIVLVQDPLTAEFDGMPRTAIAAGIANYVLPVEQMPQVISTYAHHPYVADVVKALEDENDPETTQNLINIIHARRGYDFSGYKRGTLLRRIERRMGLRGILEKSAYVKLLKQDTDEVDALFKDLLIGVTEFFRDAEAWKTLASEVIAPLVAAKEPGETIRIWTPGCSTGEEAYTMAMVVLDRLRRARKTCPVQIFATDTNNDALEVGRCGRYPVGIAARIAPSRLRRYFVREANHQEFQVSNELRSSIIFGSQNLFSDPPFGRVDLISCRNVLIYLESDLQKRVLNIFHFALRKGACLFLGSAESNGNRDDLFNPISKKWRIFRREGITSVEMLALPLRLGDSRPGTLVNTARNVLPLSQVAGIAQKLILDRFAPASVLVNSRHEALYFCGPTEDFLTHPRGAPSQDVFAMVKEGLRSRLSAALKEAANSNLTVVSEGARMKISTGFAPVEITVAPHPGLDTNRLFLIVFRQNFQPLLIPSEKSTEEVLVRHLEEELQATQEELCNALERFETSTEDLKVSNEEVVTTNEELRSLNEELESSKEELQSLNEELTTVNQQLDAKVHELEVSNTDLNNLLNSSDIATICLDRSLCLQWFTPATKTQFKFMNSDIGRPIRDFSLTGAGSGLIEAATAVLASQAVDHHTFQTEEKRSYIRRVLPYLNEHAEVSGVIVTYTDITESDLAAQAVSSVRQDLSDSLDFNKKMRTLSAALAMAETRERRALSQELHDDLGQLLAMIKIKLTMMENLKIPKVMRSAMDSCAKVVDQANRKLRIMAFQLSPPMLDELGLASAIEWIADEMHEMYKIDVTVVDDGKPKPMNPTVNATLFRAVRELLINIAKHAHVEKATVTTTRGEGNLLIITVSDSGAGFNPEALTETPESVGFGLLSVRERINLLGGSMKIISTPGQGTSVVLNVPLITDIVNTVPLTQDGLV